MLTRAHPWREYKELKRKLREKAREKKTKKKQRVAQGQLQKQFITSTDCPQAGVNHDERSHTKRIKSSLPAASMNDGATSGGEESRDKLAYEKRGTERERGD